MIPILILIFISSILRLTFLDQIEFKYDEALSTFQTYLFYISPYLPQTGIMASTGMYNFPLFNYLLIVIGLFSQNQKYLSFVIALINIGMIVIFYLFNKKLFGKIVAFISSIVLAISPWAIIFSRKIWAQDFILLFAIPFYYFFIKTMENKKALNISLLTFFLFLLIQLHGSGIFLMLATIGIFIGYKIKTKNTKIFKGAMLAAIFLIPYLIFELSSDPFCRDCISFINYQKLSRPFDIENFLRPFQIINGLNFQFLLGNDYNSFLQFNAFIQPIFYVFIIEVFLLLGISIYFYKEEKSRRYLLQLIIIIPALYFITRTSSYIHYYVILLPIICLLYGLLFKYIYDFKKNKLFKGLVITIFLIFSLSKIIFMYSFFQYLSLKQSVSGDYGPTFKLTDQAVLQNIREYSFEPDFDIIKQYSYIFINTSIFHQKLAEYFINTNRPNLAANERR